LNNVSDIFIGFPDSTGLGFLW